MMPGINWDRAFSNSNKVDGDLSRFVTGNLVTLFFPFFYLTKTFVLPKVTSVRNFRSSSRTLLTIYFDENFHENLAPD